ncbi:unnamed protein product [Thelazia callipaeda]|uniref:Uncharacterized protein n=1 Tax=Thelazia callipaeda TaxID=103827 RepID=A0A0N5D0V6_THECL|nr:unnamed protein product [Thelazia callipaeda]
MRLQWIILFCCSCFGILNTQMPPPKPPRSSSLARFGSRGYAGSLSSIPEETIEMRRKNQHHSLTLVATEMPKVLPEVSRTSAKIMQPLDDNLEETHKDLDVPPPKPPRSTSLVGYGPRCYGSRLPSIPEETIEMRRKNRILSLATSPVATKTPKVIPDVPKYLKKIVDQKAESEVPETKGAMTKVPEKRAVSAKKADYLNNKLEEAYKEFEDSLKLFEPTLRERLTHLRKVELKKFTNIAALSEKADYDGLRNQSELVIIEDLKEKMLPNSSHSNQLETKNDFCIEKFLKELDAMATEYENFLKRREDIQLEMLSSPEIDSTSPELESSDDSESDYMAMLDSLNITQSNDSNEKETDWKQIAYSVFGG